MYTLSPTTTANASARKLATAWFCLALAALGLSALAAAALGLVRTAFFDLGPGVFVPALALHMAFAAPIWLLALTSGLLTWATERCGLVEWGSWWLALAGTCALAISPFFGTVSFSAPLLLPVIDNALFLGGMATFGLAIGATFMRSLGGLRRLVGGPPWQAALAWTLPVLAVVFALALAEALKAETVAGIADPMWGVSYAFLFSCILLLLGAWFGLAGNLANGIPIPSFVVHGAFALATLPVLGVTGLIVAFPVGSAEYVEGILWLARRASWPPALGVAIVLAARLVAQARRHQLTLEQCSLALSVLLFAAGCTAGFLNSSGDPAAVPAFLHGVWGSITLACLLWWLRLAVDRSADDPLLTVLSRSALGYGLATMVFVVALAAVDALSGRPTQLHGSMALTVAMALVGIAGAVAALAIAAFAVFGMRVVLHGQGPVSARQGDRRPLAIGITVLLVAGGGWLVYSLPRSSGGFSPKEHAAQRIQADIDARFQQGVVMLHAKQYEHALTAFHRVMQLAPEMPEAYVNAGFALLGMKRYKEAGDFFESATQLRKTQVNAYFGLAVALEGMGDLQGALGAMETYVHLSKPDDPFRTKAEAAIWEWRTALDRTKQLKPPAAK